MHPSDAYTAASEGVLVLNHPQPDVFWMSGADRADFLNRICTNKVDDMESGAFRSTVLTRANARIIDVLHLLHEEDKTLILCSPGSGPAVESILSSYIFFQDDVLLEPAPVGGMQFWGIYGPESRNFLEETLSIRDYPKPLQFLTSESGAILPFHSSRLNGYRLLTADRDPLDPSLNEVSQEHCWAAYETLRIESGLPEWGKEITEERIPLEVGLDHLIHDSKGCYIGQEIITRMKSRGQPARVLMGIALDGLVAEGSSVRQNGRNIGAVTSVAQSPRLGAIGLVVVKPKDLELETPVDIQGTLGRLTELPFS